jgi:osmoprotectant transport system substrate-binding protein
LTAACTGDSHRGVGKSDGEVAAPGPSGFQREIGRTPVRLRLAVGAASLALAIGVCACGGGGGGSSSTLSKAPSNLIRSSPGNGKTTITVGSKNFTEAVILGQIYAQALAAAGYQVRTRLDLGPEKVALKALQDGRISGYPEYISTALGSFFQVPASKIPTDSAQAYEQVKSDFARQGIVAYPPTPFADSNAVGTLTTTAERLGLKDISDLAGKSQQLVLAGSPECRGRFDCLAGLEQSYGLRFKQFRPVPIDRRYAVLDNREADLSILFTSDAQLAASTRYTILKDDRNLIPAVGNVVFVVSKKVAAQAGPDLGATIENVQSNMTLPVIQELNSRVDIEGRDPAAVARQYLQSLGYVARAKEGE